jgi:ribose 5-phosphate isomerase B
MAMLSRQHNDANVLVLGARIISAETAKNCIKKFLSTDFEGGRHQRRVNLIDD